jgi:hypothetical protein
MRTLLFNSNIGIIFLWSLNFLLRGKFLLAYSFTTLLVLVDIKRSRRTCSILHSAIRRWYGTSCRRPYFSLYILNNIGIIATAYPLLQAKFRKKLAVATTCTWDIMFRFILNYLSLIRSIQQLLCGLEYHILFEVFSMDYNPSAFSLSSLPSSLKFIFLIIILRLRRLSQNLLQLFLMLMSRWSIDWSSYLMLVLITSTLIWFLYNTKRQSMLAGVRAVTIRQFLDRLRLRINFLYWIQSGFFIIIASHIGIISCKWSAIFSEEPICYGLRRLLCLFLLLNFLSHYDISEHLKIGGINLQSLLGRMVAVIFLI